MPPARRKQKPESILIRLPKPQTTNRQPPQPNRKCGSVPDRNRHAKRGLANDCNSIDEFSVAIISHQHVVVEQTKLSVPHLHWGQQQV